MIINFIPMALVISISLYIIKKDIETITWFKIFSPFLILGFIEILILVFDQKHKLSW